jgi:hypothetical protein
MPGEHMNEEVHGEDTTDVSRIKSEEDTAKSCKGTHHVRLFHVVGASTRPVSTVPTKPTAPPIVEDMN